MKAHQGEMKAMREAWLGRMEASQEKVEAILEHYEAVSHAEATDVLHGDLKEATYETVGATEGRFGDQELAVGYRSQL
jgi:hypothetical protein